MSRETLQKSIYSMYDSDHTAGSLYALTNGNFGQPTIEPRTKPPYLIGEIVDDKPEYISRSAAAGPKAIEKFRYQFTIVTNESVDQTLCESILNKVRELFDNQTFSSLTLADYKFVKCRRDTGHGPFLVEERIVATIDYQIWMQTL